MSDQDDVVKCWSKEKLRKFEKNYKTRFYNRNWDALKFRLKTRKSEPQPAATNHHNNAYRAGHFHNVTDSGEGVTPPRLSQSPSVWQFWSIGGRMRWGTWYPKSGTCIVSSINWSVEVTIGSFNPSRWERVMTPIYYLFFTSFLVSTTNRDGFLL